MQPKERHFHILPLWVYLSVGGSLFVLTGVTVAASFINLGGAWNLILAMLIATVKASLVALFFMHLFYDNKLYAVIFSIGLFMVAFFIIITMFDTLRRGEIYTYKSQTIQKEASMYATLQAQSTEASPHHDTHKHKEKSNEEPENNSH